MNRINKLLLFVSFFLISIHAATAAGIVYMIPTGKTHEGLEVYTILKSSDALYFKAKNKLDRGYVSETLFLHEMVQNYLLNTGRIQEKRPVYLALTENIGGFAKTGFALEEDGTITALPDVRYIDLHRNILDENPAELGSYKEIFPHELGHILLSMLSGQGTSPISRVHYFCTLTDYQTAFNEGFAEHFQVMSHTTEPDERIRRAFQEDIRKAGLEITPFLHKYRRDYEWPARMGFCRALTPFWYQRLENMRRHSFVESKLIKFPPRMARIDDPWDAVLYRDGAVWPDLTKQRTPENAMSVEGVISAFFSFMLQSELKKNYYPPMYYRAFLPSDSGFVFEREIHPLRNQYLKIFTVLAKYVRMDGSERGPLIDFIEGYIREFPQEERIVKAIWQEASGTEYAAQAAREVWVTYSQAHFAPWVLAQFGPRMKEYTFNINTADSVDWVALEGLTPGDALKINSHRVQTGGFSSLEQIKAIPGLEGTTVDALGHLQPWKESSEESGRRWSIGSLLTGPLRHFLITGLLYFFVIALMYAAAAFFSGYKPKPIYYIYNFLAFSGLILAGPVFLVMMPRPILLFALLILLIMGLQYLRNRKNLSLAILRMAVTLVMGGIVVYSMY